MRTPNLAYGRVSHLVRRFVGAARPGAPDPTHECWALTRLGEGERQLWARMNNPDQRHAIEVAHRVVEQLGSVATRPVIAAALLHDVGKIESGLRTPARVVATLVWAVIPDEYAPRWLEGQTIPRRLAQYRLHPLLGEQLLVGAGADVITSSWAGDHHLDRSAWRVATELGDVLKACDDD